MTNHALTMNQCKRAAEIYASGYSIMQVADALGCSGTAVKTALRVIGVPTRPKFEARVLRNRMRGLPQVVCAASQPVRG